MSLILLLFPLITLASTCDELWFHIAGVSKHIAVYEPNQYTRYKRQTHPGVGIECKTEQYTFAMGQFTNSLDKPFQYGTMTKNVFELGRFTLFAGLLAGEYGRTEREPLRIVAPITYVEFTYQHAGFNFFVLPPARGINDYTIFYTQFKVQF